MTANKDRRGLDALFRPKSVAVIGASNRRLAIGCRIVRNLQKMQFRGPVYPVHPKASHILGLPVYPTILAVPGEVDLAHIIVKNTLVPRVLEDCARKGVRVAIINTDPEVSAYCNFTFTRPRPGHISIFSQSGGVGEVINNRLCELGEGLRMYASTGNACDLQCPEVLEYWRDDPETRVIICHLESIEAPDHFAKVAREVSQKKPILAILTGRTAAGARAVAYHCGGAITGGTGESISRASGLLPFKSLEELCQAARAFVHLPRPPGRRVGIITNTGGPGVIAADELIEAGLELPEPGEATQDALRQALYPEAIVSNPVDVLATAGPEHFRAALVAMLGDPQIDSVLLSFVTPFFVDCEAVAREIVALAAGTPKPIVCVVMTEKTQWSSTLEIFRGAGLPTFDLPEIGARVLAAMSMYRGQIAP